MEALHLENGRSEQTTESVAELLCDVEPADTLSNRVARAGDDKGQPMVEEGERRRERTHYQAER